MKYHVTKLAAVCHYHLRRLGQIRRRVGIETRLVLAMITSRLDHCNSVLAGLPQSTLDPLQRLQDAAARVIFNVGKQEHVSLYLEQLHWLPVRARVQFKMCTLMHAIYNKRCPAYLADVVQLVGMASTRTGLRSADSSNYFLPRLNTRVESAPFHTQVRPPGTNYPRASASCKLHLSNINSRHFFLHSVITLPTDCVY